MDLSRDVEAMIRAIVSDYRSTAGWTGRREPAARVLDAMRRVPRDEFVPEPERSFAWANTALPIGLGQTISQPYVVALMSELLDVRPGLTVLEIGTGSGYQAAVLAELGARVFSVEIVEELARTATARLARLGYLSVEVRHGDGGDGWPERAPFDRVVATAAARAVPDAWFDQLVPGGRLVAPEGPHPDVQALLLFEKRADGTVERRSVLPVRFVPLTGRTTR